ncbi:MAG: decaprenyl-phosphate phosphoribosyltransferase [Deinococcus sp.]|nr:decaprenyl-phosphate phosphoribosyltransferase [Deinococcus sp.]
MTSEHVAPLARPKATGSLLAVLIALVLSMRPKQWTKNAFVGAALIFSQQLLHLDALARTAAAIALFCLLSGAVYLVNDLTDLEADRQHPRKRHRPLASGRLSPKVAAVAAVLSVIGGLVGSFALSVPFGATALAYLLLNLAYSLWLKHVVILDVLSVALGFVLRAAAGAAVLAVELSPWLLACTILLALFLALSKRRHELTLLESGAGSHRPILEEYSVALLDQMISVVTSSTVVAYALYTLSPRTVEEFGSNKLVYTVPFVLYGIFRYLYLIHQRDGGGNPEQLLLSDRPLLVSVLLWVVTAAILVYVVRYI